MNYQYSIKKSLIAFDAINIEL